ncbi:MAG TPA: hypothetical protein VH120_10535, partial [Gemmataceae bacterium]|nr:hypothetical protein [Gemmataceae bacterium]
MLVSLWLFRLDAILFLVCGVIVPPLVTLPVLAYAGERVLPARVIALVVWLCLAALGAFQTVSQTAEAAPALNAAVWAAVASGLTILLGIACFSPRVRAMAAIHLPINPHSFVHATALASVVVATILFIIPLLLLGGPPALSEDVLERSVEQFKQVPADLILRLMCYIYVWVIASLVCFVGFPIARSFRAALGRMGLVVPSPWQLVGALACAVVLVGVMAGVDLGIAWLWSTLGWP